MGDIYVYPRIYLTGENLCWLGTLLSLAHPLAIPTHYSPRFGFFLLTEWLLCQSGLSQSVLPIRTGMNNGLSRHTSMARKKVVTSYM